MQPCLFCSGDASAPDHHDRCDGRQGRREAAFNPQDAFRPLYGSQGDAPYESSSETSAAAAASLDADLSRLEAYVFAVLARAARTCDAVEVATGLSHQTVSARVRGLVLRDRIVDSGDRAPTRSGRLAVIWRVK